MTLGEKMAEREVAPARPAPGRRSTGFLPARALKRPSFAIGLAILAFWIVMALVGDRLAPYGPTDLKLLSKFAPPSVAHWLGADNLGRDVLSRILSGSRTVLFVSSCAAILGVLTGTAIGLVAAYFGG